MTEHGPEVGIVVAAFNAERFIGAALDSIVAQTHRQWTCLVVDDGSTDRTSEIATAYARRHTGFHVIRQANAGPCVARNAGLAALPEEAALVTFMDADDVWRPTALERLIEALRDSCYVGAHGLGEFIDRDGHRVEGASFATLGRDRFRPGWIPHRLPSTAPSTFGSIALCSTIFPPGLVLARRTAYETVGGFDEAMRFAEDWDVLIRLARAGDLAFVDEVVLGYRRHDTNVGARPEVPAACARVRRRTHFSHENDARQRRIVRDVWRSAQILDALDRMRALSDAVRARRVRVAIRQLVTLPVLTLRYLRGHPPSIRAEELVG
jgi:glycosyltransferase involved in cell wall biosynthesis